jgi:DNA-binding CsgD family transcriptional regulator
VEVLARRRWLASRLTELVGGDLWVWATVQVRPESGEVAGLSLLSDGWKAGDELGKFVELCDSDFGRQAIRGLGLVKSPATMLRNWLVGDGEYAESRWQRESAFDDFVVTVCPTGSQTLSCVAIHREKGRARFGEMELTVMHLVLSQVPWLHQGLENPELAEITLGLTPRQRQVLVQVLCGRTTRDIGTSLGISLHTVNDHIKAVLEGFGVRSRNELLSRYLSGQLSTAVDGTTNGAEAGL